MTDWQKDYWAECISGAAEECGLALDPVQLDCLAESVKTGHEHFGMASGHDVASANLTASREGEVTDLKKSVEREQRKVMCTECRGKGRIRISGPYHWSNMHCDKCGGEGRHDP